MTRHGVGRPHRHVHRAVRPDPAGRPDADGGAGKAKAYLRSQLGSTGDPYVDDVISPLLPDTATLASWRQSTKFIRRVRSAFPSTFEARGRVAIALRKHPRTRADKLPDMRQAIDVATGSTSNDCRRRLAACVDGPESWTAISNCGTWAGRMSSDGPRRLHQI
jgi:hypothetical protein